MAEQGRPYDGLSGVALWCPTLLGISRAHGLATRDGRQGELLVFSGPCWLSRLGLWLDEVGEETQQATRGLELDHPGGLSPWNSVPLERLLKKLQTPWFSESLEHGRLAIHLQPLLLMQNQSVVGFEALARSHAGGRDLGGGEIVSAAEAHGRMAEFERKALETAATSAYPKLLDGESLFINILPESMADADAFEQQVLRNLTRKGVDLTQIVFEIVETDALPPLRDLMATVDRIRAYGSMVAVDDLGSGCAAFTCIVDIEPDVVKLDRSLLQLEEASDCGIIQSLTSCAHSVGALVVAEGIETAEHFDLVKAAGVDMAQGWFIGRPSPDPQRHFRDRPFLS